MECKVAHHDQDHVFERIFHPRSVAVIGVSSQAAGFGSGIVDALRAIGFQGALYGVNPKGGTYRDMKLFTSLADIPDPIDFAVIAVPAGFVPETLEECRRRGIAGAEILSAGFSETGTPEGSALEEEVRRISARGIRVVGPNCFGIYCPQSGLTLLPG
ncbi:MAG TPA: CoA-binding protein, partial [Deltaproteobacteria bacterium]|nr:CoA-binding protein [Deltaproteobacteria bacterium]